MSDRTFVVADPHMHGPDVKTWQGEVVHEFDQLAIPGCPIKIDSDYGVSTRAFTASLCHALGMYASDVMKGGVTPELRTRIRHRDLSKSEEERFHSVEYVAYRRNLAQRWDKDRIKVHTPVTRILGDDWGYHPGVHDGIDVLCPANAVLFAMIRAKVIDVRSGGWWGLGAQGSAGHPVSEGDGIVQLQVLDSVGPFKRGHHIGYGHCEHAKVKVGQTVKAGTPIALAGFAKAWHIHLMYNDGTTMKGIGNIDPRRILNFAVRND